MPILFAITGSALGCFAEGAILGASVYLVSRGDTKSGEIIEALAQVLTTTFLPDSFMASTLFSSLTLIYGPFFNERLIISSINQITSFLSQ